MADLPSGERRVYAEAGVLDATLRLVTLLGSFATARAVARALAGRARPTETDIVVRAVEASGRVVPGSNCLSEALTAWVLLRRAGREPEVRIGVAKRDGLRAHAWVECDGVVVVGARSGDGFHPLEGGDLMRT